jgi:hypothetical protein
MEDGISDSRLAQEMTRSFLGHLEVAKRETS